MKKTSEKERSFSLKPLDVDGELNNLPHELQLHTSTRAAESLPWEGHHVDDFCGHSTALQLQRNQFWLLLHVNAMAEKLSPDRSGAAQRSSPSETLKIYFCWASPKKKHENERENTQNAHSKCQHESCLVAAGDDFPALTRSSRERWNYDFNKCWCFPLQELSSLRFASLRDVLSLPIVKCV